MFAAVKSSWSTIDNTWYLLSLQVATALVAAEGSGGFKSSTASKTAETNITINWSGGGQIKERTCCNITILLLVRSWWLYICLQRKRNGAFQISSRWLQPSLVKLLNAPKEHGLYNIYDPVNMVFGLVHRQLTKFFQLPGPLSLNTSICETMLQRSQSRPSWNTSLLLLIQVTRAHSSSKLIRSSGKLISAQRSSSITLSSISW